MARSSSVSIRLDIDKQSQALVDRALRTLPQKVYDKVVGQAAAASVRPMVTAARSRVSTEHGTLKKSLGVKRKNYKNSGVVFVAVGPRKGFRDEATGEDPVNIAHLVEFGTKSHMIGSKKIILAIGPIAIRGTVQHPGSGPKPFLRPAYDEKKGGVLKIYRKKLLAGIEREAKKLAAKV